MKKKAYILSFVVLLVILIAGFFVVKNAQAPSQNQNMQKTEFDSVSESNSVASSVQQNIQKQTVDPIDGALSRITKKPFGIFITPKTSPVQLERFSGYHTGTDLETTPAEQNIDVPVLALCDGKLLLARFASGYGGVAVQSCTLDGQAVTVVYGHIKLTSVKIKAGEQLKAGDLLANLGTGFSNETDGERKHLHLAIHMGSVVDILGYVQSKTQLSSWIDPQKYLN